MSRLVLVYTVFEKIETTVTQIIFCSVVQMKGPAEKLQNPLYMLYQLLLNTIFHDSPTWTDTNVHPQKTGK